MHFDQPIRARAASQFAGWLLRMANEPAEWRLMDIEAADLIPAAAAVAERDAERGARGDSVISSPAFARAVPYTSHTPPTTRNVAL